MPIEDVPIPQTPACEWRPCLPYMFASSLSTLILFIFFYFFISCIRRRIGVSRYEPLQDDDDSDDSTGLIIPTVPEPLPALAPGQSYAQQVQKDVPVRLPARFAASQPRV